MTDHDRHGSVVIPRPEPELKPFIFAPLNHLQASLRLIRVSEMESPEGYIQCEVRHATIDTPYICLSYVWGDEEQRHTIILDKKNLSHPEQPSWFLDDGKAKTKAVGKLAVDRCTVDRPDER
ncbi:dihydroflavonol-4-reductase [Alternaria alternata]|nr:dihydroflavonol-4-reductase [Alternaria alternata]